MFIYDPPKASSGIPGMVLEEFELQYRRKGTKTWLSYETLKVRNATVTKKDLKAQIKECIEDNLKWMTDCKDSVVIPKFAFQVVRRRVIVEEDIEVELKDIEERSGIEDLKEFAKQIAHS